MSLLRELKWPLTAVVCCLLLGGPVAAAAYSNYMTERVDVGNHALLRDGVATADVTTFAYSTTTDMSVARAQWVCFEPRFAGGSDTCTIRPIYFNADLEYVGSGIERSFTAGANLDPDGLYVDDGDEAMFSWESRGAVYVVPWVTAVSGTVDIWGCTR